MRTLLQISLPTEAANKALTEDPNALKKLEEFVPSLKPEAGPYFTSNDMGERSFFVVFDLSEPSRIPVIAEPLFEMFHARIKFRPLMNWDDVKKGLQEVQRTMSHYHPEIGQG